MITHVQTALRKAGNYDKTGRARKNTERARLFVYTTTADRRSRQVGGGGTRAGHGVARASPLLGHRLRDDSKNFFASGEFDSLSSARKLREI